MTIQQKYFPNAQNECILFGFVGRITAQKGVHLILDIAEQLLRRHSGRVQIMVCGASNPGEAYSAACSHRMKELAARFPNNFWADPDAFFLDGPLLNLGADFGLMPSAFEPGGIVQQEFMVAGTPVIAFKTGGLRDTISEFVSGNGNGFTFEAHTGGDLAYAIERAMKVYAVGSSYALLRENALKSVVSCDMVARAWLKEFYRLANKGYYESHAVAQIVSQFPITQPTYTDSYTNNSTDQSASEDEEGYVSSPVSLNKTSSSMGFRTASVVGIARKSVRVLYKPNVVGDLPRSVLLSGSFDQWASRIPLKWDKNTRNFFVDIRIPQGKWFIKLIVDGCWMCVPDYPIEKDYQGNSNNVVLVD